MRLRTPRLRMAGTLYRAMVVTVLGCSVVFAGAANTKGKKNPAQPPTSLQQFLQRVQGVPVATTTSLGSLWPLEGRRFTDLATDYKARRLNDLVIIRIVEQTLAQASGTTSPRNVPSPPVRPSPDSRVRSISASFNPLYGLELRQQFQRHRRRRTASLCCRPTWPGGW
jgi:hypothetical protein